MSDQPPTWPSDDVPPSSSVPPPPPPPAPSGGFPPPQGSGFPAPQGSGFPAPQGGPGMPPPPVSSQAGQPASYGVRFVARLVDGLVLLIPNFVVGAIIGGDPADLSRFGFRAWLAGVISTLIAMAFFVYFDTNQGRTPGKSAMGLQIVGQDGGHPTQEQSIKRNAFILMQVVPGVGGLMSLIGSIAVPITGSGDGWKRGWHDKMAGTYVVRTK